MHDLVIKGGTVVDGTGAAAAHRRCRDHRRRRHRGGPRRRRGAARRSTPTASLVTPGFVDMHTHYDGQVTWDPLLTPIVLARRDHRGDGQLRRRLRAGRARRARLADRADGGRGGHPRRRARPPASNGGGRAFPEYLDASTQPRGSSTSAPRCRTARCAAYVMGERGARNEPATPDDIDAMAAIVRDGIAGRRARLLDQSHDRPPAIDGEPVPGTFAAEDELFGIGRVLGELGHRRVRAGAAGALGEDLAAPEREMAWMRRLAAADRPAGHVRAHAEQRRSRPVAAHARPVRRRRRPRARRCDRRCTAAPCRAAARASRRSTRSGSRRAWGATGWACCPGPSRSPASPPTPSCGARSLAEARRSTTTRSSWVSCEPKRVFPLGDPPDYEPPPSRVGRRDRRGARAPKCGRRSST